MESIEQHARAVMEWMYERHPDDDEGPLTYLEHHGLDRQFGYQIVNYLHGQGWVQPRGAFGPPAGRLTPEGIAMAQSAVAERADPRIRGEKLRQAMLLWLDDRETRRLGTSSWDLFLEHAASDEVGGYDEGEVRHGAEYLHEYGLVGAVSVNEERDGWIGPTLKVAGRTCAREFGGDVFRYLNHGRAQQVVTNQSSTTNTVYVSDNHGNLSVAGQDISQAMTNAGLDVTQILELAGGVAQFAPVLRLPADVEHEITEAADQLHAEATNGKPDRGRLRTLVDRISTCVKKAAPTVGQRTLLQLVDQAFKALGGG